MSKLKANDAELMKYAYDLLDKMSEAARSHIVTNLYHTSEIYIDERQCEFNEINREYHKAIKPLLNEAEREALIESLVNRDCEANGNERECMEMYIRREYADVSVKDLIEQWEQHP